MVSPKEASGRQMNDLWILSFVDEISSRLARRGGVKRISATIYDEVRTALKTRLTMVSHQHLHFHD
jgi:histone H3/H4